MSSPRLFEAMREGLLSCGLEILDVGLVPTPLLYFSVIDLVVDGGVMITGSHNPPEHNGFKIVSGGSTIFGEDIQQIKQILLKDDFKTGKGSVRQADVKASYVAKVKKSIRH